MKVKICGVTTLDDALMAARAGADMIGLNFYPKSPRYLQPDAARDLADALRAYRHAAQINDYASRSQSIPPGRK